MKKILFMFFVASVLSVTSEKAFAQFEKGDKLLNVGINLGGTYGGGVGVGASFEGGVHDFISVGAQADFVTWNYGYFGYKWRYNFLTIAARGSYHYGKHFLTMDNLDLYAGPALGYRVSSFSDPDGYNGIYDDGYGSGVFFGAFAGARYYFKPTMGVFAEVGYNASPLKAGIAFKF
ncbi:hypothetical protein [Dyadobacter arcticus]|uniref:Outer membrane protein beta-barrel domain-containing protein n=1 Tax=Dyadobacter arcticus TaxID=1078754 RepID=A0ABX0UCZ2_9BACT|nr:hypothetical protein [Dyadobacter arcticus]NIJ50883.1 hypothetical protein [Dyadobacter arcticus]